MSNLYLGDTHGNWAVLARTVEGVLDKHPVQRIVQIGDCGVYRYAWAEGFVNLYGIPLEFIDGNHEDHDFIWSGDYASKFVGVTYIPRGTIRDGVLYIGGAESIDKEYQIAQGSWSADEQVSIEDRDRTIAAIEAYMASGSRIHTVVAHDTTYEGANHILDNEIGARYKSFSRTHERLEMIFEVARPDRWIHGHWHIPCRYCINGCEFIGLDKIDRNDDHTKIGSWLVL